VLSTCLVLCAYAKPRITGQLVEQIDEEVVPVEFKEEFAEYYARRPRAIGAQDLAEEDTDTEEDPEQQKQEDEQEKDQNEDEEEKGEEELKEGEITHNIETEAEGQNMVLKVVDRMKIMNKWINGIVENWEDIIKESGVVSEADMEEAQALGRSNALVSDDENVEYDMMEEAEEAEDTDKEATTTEGDDEELPSEGDDEELPSEGDDEELPSESDDKEAEEGDAEEAEGVDEEAEKDEDEAQIDESDAEMSDDSIADFMESI